MNKRKVVPYLLLLFAFLVWLYLKPKDTLTALPEHHPSYIAYNLNSVHFDENGEISYEVTAAKSTHFSNQENTLFEKPKITFHFQTDKEPPTVWQLSSDKGVLTGVDKLTLSGDVWLRNLSKDQFIQTMNTEELNIVLSEKEVSSDLLVYWTGPQMKQQGIGMWASLVREELIVNNQIKAVYLNEAK